MIKYRLENGRISSSSIPLRKWTINAMAERVPGALPTPCWIIPGCEIMSDRGGHARYRQYGKREFVHRLSYKAFKGAIPEGLCVCHHCDNPPCCNPEHLWLGTNSENTADRVTKGRTTRGERHYNSKLTEVQIVQIRSLLSENKRHGLGMELARQFGVSPCTISDIKVGRGWKHGPGQGGIGT